MVGLRYKALRTPVLLAVGVGVFVVVFVGAGAPSAATSASGHQVTPNADIAYARAQVAKFKRVPKFVAPGPAFKVDVRGKLIFDIPQISSVPFVIAIEKAEEKIVKRMGAKFVLYPNQGQPAQWAQGVLSALARKADILQLLSADPFLLAPQLRQVHRAGIPVLETLYADVGYKFPPEVTAQVPSPYRLAGRLMADYAIAHSNGKANVLVIVSRELIPSQIAEPALRSEFQTRCSACKVSIVNVPITQWATKVQTTVQSALIRNPDINYVIPMFDGEAQFAVAGIRASHAGDRVKVISFNGTPAILDLMRQKNPIVIMDIGQSVSQIAWAIEDQAFRILNKQKPLSTENITVRIFDASNVREAGIPAKLDTGYGNAYIKGYLKLWGVTK